MLFAWLLAVTTTTQSAITGRVVDQATHKPITSAVVQIDHSNRRVLTDSAGRFVLTRTSDDKHTLVVTALGYRRTTIEAKQGAPTEVELPPEAVPLPAIIAISRTRPTLSLRGATLRVFGREDLIAAGDIPIAQFVNWKAHLFTRPCHLFDADTVPPSPGECIVGSGGSHSPVMVMVDNGPMQSSDELWAQNTWDIGRLEVVNQYSGNIWPFNHPRALVKLYTLGYLARTAGRGHICDRVAIADTTMSRYVEAICGR